MTGRARFVQQSLSHSASHQTEPVPRKIGALIHEEFGITVSKDTIKRILKMLRFSWHRVHRKVKGQPDPQEYQQKKEELEE
jgi:transposase